MYSTAIPQAPDAKATFPLLSAQSKKLHCDLTDCQGTFPDATSRVGMKSFQQVYSVTTCDTLGVA